MTIEAAGETRLAELEAAFRVFTGATVTLERQYRALQEHVAALRAELEEKQRALTASIERQRCLEEQALRQGRLAAMGEMAATLAHEVRNPLGAMELFVRTLEDEVGASASARRLLGHIAAGIEDLNHLVGNILDYTRLPEPQRTPLALDAVIDEALALVPLAPSVAVERRPAPTAVCAIDRGLVKQALVNLVRNAAEAMPGGGTLRIAVEPQARWARIVIADSGPGVPPELSESIFAPFVTTKARGTGLGLAVTRAAVAAHGGTLALRPSRGAGGAVFVITLPVGDPDAAAPMD
jgi:signal transduction histidine kinase